MEHRSYWSGYAVLLAVSLLTSCTAIRQTLQNQPCILNAIQPYDTIHVDPLLHNLTLHWKDPATNEPFETIQNLVEWLEKTGHSVIAVTNAGIFEPGLVPTGLYIENGDELHPLNLREGYGNFYLKPNGIFFVQNGLFGIMESTHFDREQIKADQALQSGPLLLQNSQLHTAFTRGSKNCRLRSGIGVASDGRVIIAISNGAVNFFDFGIWFRDAARVTDALYLDGAISVLHTEAQPSVTQEKFAGFIAVTRKKIR